MLTIGFIGNFRPLFSTEQDRKWSFEKLGYNVKAFQEDETTSEQILAALPKLDMLMYSHTHGWEIDGLIEVFKKYKEVGVPTVSAHLDRWAWLKRVEDVGKEATWFTEYVFMADGSPEAVKLYTDLNLNWHYLKPGVIERDCYMVKPATVNGLQLYKYPEIVFTGSRNYHPEYPFRPQLVDFLEKTYGDRFGYYGNQGKVVRMGELNELYGAAKIVVGDSCFGGRPNYVSDRYYEVRGRGGFLLHPHTEGIDTVGVGHYTKENLLSLQTAIDYWLEHDEEREDMRIKGFNHVKNNETYTDRSREILEVVFK